MAGIVWLGYWIPKRRGNKKLGKVIAGILATGFVLLILAYIFDDYLFFKSDARKNLAEMDIELVDGFKILSNEDGGLMDYYHTFSLEISGKDKERLIDQIKSSTDYTDSIQEYRYLPSEAENRYEGDTLKVNYQTEREYRKEIFYPNGQGYTPTYKIVSISKSKNELKFEHILD
ncbi:hypothetical protein [Pseudozobellia sp. WGM2]|uniref:hypothetical protein n=1 Tax=Pseudozobellia sp. WGM2 TaxID=2787625 RepID=UPI001AE03328|nr:hypothetical protein [Pseudozobellia sp. WGM2]